MESVNHYRGVCFAAWCAGQTEEYTDKVRFLLNLISMLCCIRSIYTFGNHKSIFFAFHFQSELDESTPKFD